MRNAICLNDRSPIVLPLQKTLGQYGCCEFGASVSQQRVVKLLRRRIKSDVIEARIRMLATNGYAVEKNSRGFYMLDALAGTQNTTPLYIK